MGRLVFSPVFRHAGALVSLATWIAAPSPPGQRVMDG